MAGDYEFVAGTLDTGDGGHVDNAVYPKYVATVRERFLRETVPRFEAYERPVVRLEVDYHAELFAGETFYGEVEVLDVGTTSFTTEITLSTEDETITTAKTVQVLVDPDADEPTPVPDDWRAALT
ncbi:MAG: acyl-CoA thioester hydrolase [Natronomonas sp.]|jgi:acyl-CoA thioester hydrolase|uniref:acyl-CoA thioesterase n=1 Tax=Natronomonas sp. TaxID=2184060 RepID=UPI003989F363